MKKILSVIAILSLVFTFTFANPALAGDVAKGAKIFNAKCTACHAGGKNIVSPSKTLFKAALEANGMNSSEAIIAQVTNGKGAMPSFKGSLKPGDMEDVAAYVLAQADKDWKK